MSIINLTDHELKHIAKIVRYMAETGIGTEHCLEEGCLPMLSHFYSPVPNLKELQKREIWNKVSTLSGINMRAEEQILLLSKLAQLFSKECNWSQDQTADPHQFYWKNDCFSFQCASLLHYMIRYTKPKRIIEVGSGFSSRVINSCLDINQAAGTDCIYDIVDPYPSESTKTLKNLSSINIKKAEEIDIEFYTSLDSGDILFIDSGHVVRAGGDVNFLILEVLPRINPGVYIHFHDIPMPSEYSKTYFTNPGFRVFWTESYLLQAFLAFNRDFEVLAAVEYLRVFHKESLSEIFPQDPGSNSQSFWIRRVPK